MTTDNTQEELYKFLSDPETLRRAAEGSMKKRQALIDRVDSQQELDKPQQTIHQLVRKVEEYAYWKWSRQPKYYTEGARDVLFTQDMEDEALTALLDWHNKQVKNAVATAEDNLDQYWNKELDKRIRAADE